MRSFLFAAALALAATPALAAPSPIEGVWNAPVENSQVELYACGENVCGRVLNSDRIRANPALTDLKNRDESQRSRTLKGLVMLTGFSGGPKEWRGGSVYNPEDGGTYHGAIHLIAPDTLKLEGCIIYPFCQTQIWHRAK